MTDCTDAPAARPLQAPMTEAEFRAGMDLLTSAARLILMVDVDRLRDVVTQSETLAPILEPTAYIRGGGRRLAEQREFLDAAGRLRAVCERFRPGEMEGAARGRN